VQADPDSSRIEHGERIGIIGSNGAGKSTLLRLLARIYPPTSGTVTVRGSVAPLIEMGAGFNYELSGLDNILLNGAMLGFTRKQMLAKVDAIHEFTGLREFADHGYIGVNITVPHKEAALAFTRPELGVGALVGWVLFTSFAGATQDSVVDAYRIEIAPLQAQAALAATYTLGYRIGLIAGGAGALYLAEFSSWKIAYLGMAALMALPLLATLLSREPVAPEATVQRRIDFIGAFWQPFSSFFASNGLALGLALLVFVGLFKFPDQVIGVMAGPFYLDSGYTKADIATVSKLYGIWAGIGGAFLGGLCVAAFGFRRMLFVATLGVALSNLAFLLMAQYPSQIWAFYAAITADNVAQGFAGTVLVAFMSSLTDRNFTATQFALLVSLANLPGKFAGGVSGYVVEASSYSTFFVLSAVTVVPTLALLAWLWPRVREVPPPTG